MSEPIVFIHGLFHMLGGLHPEPCFAPRTVLTPDLPGFGRNRDVRDVSVPAAAEHVREAILSAGFERAHIAGHSVGGAVAVLLANRYPKLVLSFINIEGNFTLKDAFWSGKLARMDPAEADALIESYRADPAGWLARNGIEPTPERTALAFEGLTAQPTSTVQAMARSVVAITEQPGYLDQVRQILDRGTPIHLVAGERSRTGWDVPDFVLARAASMTVQPRVGHLMMLENAPEFFRIVAGLLPKDD